MHLNEALSQNDTLSRSNPESIADILGDSILWSQSSLYRAIRRAGLKAGMTYSSTGVESFLSVKLMALQDIEKTKTIPYYNSTQAARAIEALAPGVLLHNEVGPLFTKNTHYHEVIHVLGYLAMSNQTYDLNPVEFKAWYLAFIHEALADSVELLTNLALKDKVIINLFQLNSHLSGFSDAFRGLVGELLAKNDARSVLTAIFGVQLIAHLGLGFPTGRVRDLVYVILDRVAKPVSIDEAELGNLFFYQNPITNTPFRRDLNKIYFKVMKIAVPESRADIESLFLESSEVLIAYLLEFLRLTPDFPRKITHQ